MKRRSATGEASPTVRHFYRRIEPFLDSPAVFAGSVAILVLVKLLCMGMFSSDYQTKMFEPFVREFITGWKHGFSNPYQSFFLQDIEINFPYPPIMLLIMTCSEGICMLIPDAPQCLHGVLFKLPLLCMDCLIFVLLCRLYPEKRVRVLFIYFASPVILYATYMHGQLDIVPMAFLFLALYYLTGVNTQKRLWQSAVFLALSLLCKFHIAAILPIIAIYICKHRSLSRAVSYCAEVAAMVLLGILPFYGEGFISGVLLNKAQSALFAFYFSYGNLLLYASIAAVIMVYLYALNLNFINSDLVFGLGGLIFSVFLVLCAPMPGWYMWVMLFLADFVIRSNGYNHSISLFLMLQVLYLVFFLFFHKTVNGAVDLYFLGTDCSFLKFDIPVAQNVTFTLLSATMLYVTFLMHKFCIAGNSLYNFHDAALVIGICGDSGTGKSTLQDSISEMFHHRMFLRIEGDGDHKWERGDRNWETYTHLNPQANYLYRQAMDIRKLKNGESVRRVDYDHHTGRFTSKMTVHPCRFMSISGLHIFYLPQLRDIVDLRIYTEADEDLRIMWKMERDAGKRGHTREEILAQIQSRYEDARKYIYPQKEFADVVIHYFLDDAQSGAVGMKIKISTKINIEEVVTALRAAGVTLSYAFSDDFRYQILIYQPTQNQSLPQLHFGSLFNGLFAHGYDILSQPFAAQDTADGIRKLILVQAIQSKLRGEI